MMQKKKRMRITAICIILCTFLIPALSSVLVTAFSDKQNNSLTEDIIKKYIEFERDNASKLSDIWVKIDDNYNKWVSGNISRETLAELSLVPLEELNQIKKSYEEFKQEKVYDELNKREEISACIVLSGSLQLKTEVMLFDLVRGYPFANNPYAERERLDDQILMDVYGKRKKNFENEQEFFQEQLKILEKFEISRF